MNEEQNTLAFGISIIRADWERITKTGTRSEIIEFEDQFADLIKTMIDNGHGLGLAEARKVADELYQKYFESVISYDSYSLIFPFTDNEFDVYNFIYDDRFDFVFTDPVEDVRHKTELMIFNRLQGHFEYLKESQIRKVEQLQSEIKHYKDKAVFYEDQTERMREFSRITEGLKNS